MRMSRERIFYLTDLIVKELESSPAVQVKNHEDLRRVEPALPQLVDD